MAGYGDGPVELVFVRTGNEQNALTELVEQLTDKQHAQLTRSLQRLETNGLALDADYFERVTGSNLWAWRGSVQDCDVRFLYGRSGKRLVMLYGLKKKTKKLPPRAIATAEARWKAWEGGK